MQAIPRLLAALALLLPALWATALPAASREDIRHFLEVTGFDVAITSMQQSAMTGGGIAGDAPDAFGRQYAALAEKVFDPDLMLERTIDILEAGMPDALLQHGLDFYGSDLGQRLVAAENASHMGDAEAQYAEGQKILEALSRDNPARIDDYSAMLEAIGGVESAVRSITEVQVRYLLAAMAAGTVDIEMSEQELRARIKEQEPQLRQNIAVFTMLDTAYTYRDFSDDDVHAYRQALETPEMRQIYELLNAVQHEVMAERYEVLAARLAELTPVQDI
ncbi:MAG: DUF2059 domain-containing protein [Alphaproteobacteria bacterium]|nr:MAG: DUF2059 domain-containing protein [Alphaproteobacteria bacterium]